MQSKWPQKTFRKVVNVVFVKEKFKRLAVQTNCQDENNVEFVSKICSNKVDGS